MLDMGKLRSPGIPEDTLVNPWIHIKQSINVNREEME